MYVTLNPGVYLIHTYYSTLHKEKKKMKTIVHWSVTLEKKYSQLLAVLNPQYS